jgi:glycosyltransferase involved in cell wall biosynthesis
MQRKTLKIGLFVPTLSEGGAERNMAILATELSAKAPVELVVCDKSGVYSRGIPDTVRIVDLGKRNVRSAIIPLAMYLRRSRPTALLSTLRDANIAAVIARQISLVRCKLVVRESFFPGLNDSVRKFNWIERVSSHLYSYADTIVALCEPLARDMEECYRIPKHKIAVIGNPSVTKEITRLAAEPNDHPFFRQGVPVVLSAGRLIARKDHATLIRAFAIMRKREECRLIILGNGPERNALQDLIRELGLEKDTDMPGFVENPFSYMKRSSVFALTSKCEGMPNVLIQSLACETPVVATDCPGCSRVILENGKYGRLAPVGDFQAIARELMAAVDETPDCDMFEKATRRYNCSAIADQYLTLMLQ